MTEQSSRPSLENQGDLLTQLFSKYRKNNRLIISISVAAVILFLLAALALPFRNKIFEKLYPKPKSQAAVCDGSSKIPSTHAGFVFTGGDLDQAISALQTSLYDSFDLSLGPKKSFFVIGRYAQNLSDPLGLRMLLENNLSNVDFKGLPGQKPAGWTVSTDKDGTASLDLKSDNPVKGTTSVKLVSGSSSSTQISQVFKKRVSAGQFVVFGSWVKTAGQKDIKLSIRNSQVPNQEIGTADLSQIEPNKWNYILGYGKIPAGVDSFELVLGVKEAGSNAWYNGAMAAVVSSDQNQTVANLVLQRCGLAWMIDDGPGFEQTPSSPFMKPISSDIYALIYYQYYNLIKNVDPKAVVLPGGLMGAPVVFDSKTGYSPQTFLDNFRTSYKNFFNSEPPIDALGIRYLAADQNRWQGTDDLQNYLTKLRDYMDKIPDWQGKPIWLTRLGVNKTAPNEGIDFLQAAIKFLISNNLNVDKWFWYDTCGYNGQMTPLFVSNSKICTWPMKLSALGQAYVTANIIPTPTPRSSPTPAQTALPSNSTPIPTLTPQLTPTALQASPIPSASASGKLQEGTPSGANP